MLHRYVHWACGTAVLIWMIGSDIGTFRHASAEATSPVRVDALSTLQSQSTPTFALEHFYRGTDNALKEFGAARSDHAAIALDIGQCYKEIGDPIHWSPTVRAILLFELDEHMMHTLSYDLAKASGEGAQKEALPVLNPFHAAAISFSDRVSRDRLEFVESLKTTGFVRSGTST